MLQNHLKMALRHLLKDKLFSTINIIGLAVSMTVGFLILQYLNFELGYDKFHKNSDEIFRVTYRQYENHELKNTSVGTFYGVADFMKDNFPEVKEVTRFYKWPANTGVLLMANKKNYNERNYFLADDSFFKVFSSLLVEGNASTCLADPNAIIISERLAIKIFGTTNVMGRSISNLDRKGQVLVVTGVMQDIPENSHFDLDLVRPWETDWIPTKRWEYFNEWTYFTLTKGTSATDFEKKLNVSLSENQKDNPHYKGVSNVIQQISDIHFYSHLNREIKHNGDITTVYIIAGAFIMILMLAWINFVNLETARFISRLKEFAVRRIIGSTKRELIFQFFIEYLCMNAIATILAFAIIYAAQPYYYFATGIQIPAFHIAVPSLWLASLLFFAVGTLAAGIYPSLQLVRINPVASLKGKIGNLTSDLTIRKSLLAFQFFSTLTLISFVIIISSQLKFMRGINRNFNVNQIVTIYNSANYSAFEDSLRAEKNLIFKNDLLQNPAVQNFTTSSAIPGESIGFTYVDLAKRSLSDPDQQIPYKVIYIDDEFIPVFDLKLIAGRNYSEASGEDKSGRTLIVTESTIRRLGFTSVEEALDKEIYFMEDDWAKWKIIGVVADYRHESAKSAIYPTIFRFHQNKGQMVYYSILFNREDPTPIIKSAEKAWKQTWPEKPFDYFFLDSFYDQQYKAEIFFERIVELFSAVAIFIACLGLLGMTLFETNARLKELSIRKVLGASILNLITLLTKNYFVLIGLTCLAAFPFIYWIGTRWLGNFPITTNIPWILFLLPVAIVALLVLISTGFQITKAALVNPVDNLKDE